MGPRTRLFTVVFSLLLLNSGALAFAKNQRPFWTEKSSYVEGETLYAVGVASQVRSQEIGRQIAYEHGKQEIGNFIQMTDLSGLVIETQMTFEEPHPDGTFSVFRLLKVSMEELTKWKKERVARSTAELEKQNAVVAEQLERKKIQLKTLEEQQAVSADLDERAKQLQNRVANLSTQVRKRVRCGMTKKEVAEILGSPRAADPPRPLIGESDNSFGESSWNYGDLWLYFEHGVVVGVSYSPGASGTWSCSNILGK